MQTLSPPCKEKIKALAAWSEQAGTLHPEILQMAYQAGWFKLFVPKVYGGLGKKLPEILHLEEDLAEADGSLGWTVTLCAGAGWFAGFLKPKLAEKLFTNPKICFAGSGEIGGTAIKKDAGYQLDGHWRYASGALHATVFTANCYLKNEDGSDILNDEGAPEVQSFILLADEVEILSGWSYFGLLATGSHAFRVNHLWVPNERSFTINAPTVVADEGFNYPFLQLAETTLAVNILGMTKHFLKLVESSFLNRSGLNRYSTAQVDYFHQRCYTGKNKVAQLRNDFYTAFASSWQAFTAKQRVDETILDAVSQRSRQLAHGCLGVVNELYPYCGLAAAKKETEINRVWRDLHTASQHALLTFPF